jgi:hypothetical protein
MESIECVMYAHVHPQSSCGSGHGDLRLGRESPWQGQAMVDYSSYYYLRGIIVFFLYI